MVRVSPGSPSQWYATWSPWPAATWRSRQLWLTLSFPPTNHLANGQVPLEDRVPLLEPVDELGRLPGPEALVVAVGLVVDLGADDAGVLLELLGRRERATLLEQIVDGGFGHARAPSDVTSGAASG